MALATLLGAGLRLHALADQVVQDDEWHAIHKLMVAGYGEIFRSFGYADHSIPLTLLYKAMADAFGLDEINMRILQVAAGIALVPLAAAVALRVTQNAAATVLCAFLVAGAPFLVLYSRTARPYSLTLFAICAALAALWHWRTSHDVRLAAGICAAVGISAWLHPISAVFPAVAMLFILAEDALDRRDVRPVVALGAGAALAIAISLAVPLLNDFGSLSAKAGGDHAGIRTLGRMASIFAGGLSGGATAIAATVAVFGAWRLARSSPRLAAYLSVVCLVPMAVLAFLGASWSQQGHTFARYVLPAQVVLMLLFAFGFVEAVRMALRRDAVGVQLVAALTLAIGYLMVNPAIRQVATLGAWYGHLFHHYDYVPRFNVAMRQYHGYPVPVFYREIGALPPGSLTVIEAPFTSGAPANHLAYFGQYHRQHERLGLLHDLCLGGPYEGEVPKDPRFRFRNFVFLDDPAAVRATGARYIVLERGERHGRPFVEAERCIAALARLYGPPTVDAQLAVFDLRLAENVGQ